MVSLLFLALLVILKIILNSTKTGAKFPLNSTIKNNIVYIDDNFIAVPVNFTDLPGCDDSSIIKFSFTLKRFPCETELGSPGANTVHELKPGDISVVAALGDSMTAALFAKNSKLDICLLALMPEYRGVSWSIGGDSDLDTILTLPNLLKKYNPQLKGYSLGIGLENSQNANFNVAKSGAKVVDLPVQANILVNKIKNNISIDFINDWKLVTIFIGGNDLCKGCLDEEIYAPEVFRLYLKAAIDRLSKMPRTFVNLAQIVNVGQLNKLTDSQCSLQHLLIKLAGACPCMNDKKVPKMVAEYTKVIENLEKEYANRDDFTVVVQPFMEKTDIPEFLPTSYFAGDCFHFSQKSHAAGALQIWNNMFQPVGQKEKYFDFSTDILCPTKEQPYLKTSRNSASNRVAEVTAAGNREEHTKDSQEILVVIIGSMMLIFSCITITISIVILSFQFVWYRCNNYSRIK